MEVITLCKGPLTARIAPALGFNLFSLRHNDHELLMQRQRADDPPRSMGIPILFPTPNRVADGEYTFRGQRIRQQKGGVPYPIHGLVWDEPFACESWQDEAGAHARGTVAFEPGRACFEGFPFPCRLTVHYTLGAGGLSLSLRVDNTGEGVVPFGAAIHPFFTVEAGRAHTLLRYKAEACYEAIDCFPTGRLLPVPEALRCDDFRPIADVFLDTVMRRCPGATVRFLPWNLQMDIASEGFDNFVVFTPPHRPCFCLEPQTCATDAHNLYAKGLQEESGLMLLSGGESWAGHIRLTFTSLSD